MSRKSKKRKRFPRLEMDGKCVRAERIIRVAYNKMRKSRNLHFYSSGFDIYKTKQGWRAMLAFKLLGEKLVQQNIDPALYVKVMCRYGKFKNAKWMPHPTWLAKDNTIEKFRWVYRRERRSYALYLDWKKELDGWSELDIYAAIRDSANLIRTAAVSRGMKIEHTTSWLWEDGSVSPWFLATHIMRSKEEKWKDFRKCLRFLEKHRKVWNISKKAYKRSFNGLAFH